MLKMAERIPSPRVYSAERQHLYRGDCRLGQRANIAARSRRPHDGNSRLPA